MNIFATWQQYSNAGRSRSGAGHQESPAERGFPSAPERTRTSTDHTVHKALNLARLPIPPQALEAASITPGRDGTGVRTAPAGERAAAGAVPADDVAMRD